MKGIVFTEPLFHQVINGEKTQTRRIIKPQPDDVKEIHNENTAVMQVKTFGGGFINPRYKKGETLYLKEPYCICNDILLYRYDNKECQNKHICDYVGGCDFDGWQNKLFMPEKYARYYIKITGVRAERLQEIRDEDCLKEGIFFDKVKTNYFHYHDPDDRHYCENCEEAGWERLIKEAIENRNDFGFDDDVDDECIKEELDGYSTDDDNCEQAIVCDICGEILTGARYDDKGELFPSAWSAYADLIDSICGKGTWESDPLVFVYDFELI
jgi:hypothetical protein